MRLLDLPTRLRALADKIESAGLPDCCVTVALDSYECANDRAELAEWARFMGTPIVQACNESRWLDGSVCDVRVTKFFPAGLLGGKLVEVVEDDQTGLEKLLAECAAAESAGVA